MACDNTRLVCNSRVDAPYDSVQTVLFDAKPTTEYEPRTQTRYLYALQAHAATLNSTTQSTRLLLAPS